MSAVKAMRDYPPSVLEAWATWETLRQLGFSADDIYWVVAMTANAIPHPGLALNVWLKTQGKEMLVTCSGRLKDRAAAELLLEQGREFSALINARAFDEVTMRSILHDSFVWKNKIQFLSVLKHKGFKIPKAQSMFEVST